MRHLTLEALARLVDEAPEPHEMAHLEACEECGSELMALREQTEALGMLPSVLPAPDAWPTIRQRMRAEGMLRDRAGRRITPRFRITPGLLKIAASLALFLGGGLAGYAVRPLADPGTAVVAQEQTTGTDGMGGSPQSSASAVAGSPGDTRIAADGSSGETAGEEVERTEELFAAALDRYMRASGTAAPDPAARLAALDNIVFTTAEALNESPSDPVINSYHVTAVAQRRELIRQLTASDEPVF